MEGRRPRNVSQVVEGQFAHRVGSTEAQALAVAADVDANTLWVGNIPPSCAVEEVLRESLRAWLVVEDEGAGDGSDGVIRCTVRKKPGTKEKPNASWALMSFVDSDAMRRASVAKMVVTCPLSGERAVLVTKPSQTKHHLERKVRRMARRLSVEDGALTSTVMTHSADNEEPSTDSAARQPCAPQPEPEAQPEKQPAQPQGDSLIEGTLWLGSIPIEFADDLKVSKALADAGVHGVAKCTVRQKPDGANKKHRSWAFVDFVNPYLKDAALRTTVSVTTAGGVIQLKWATASLKREQGSKEAVLVEHLLAVTKCRWTAPPLPQGKRYHFFLCHHQNSGGDQAHLLCESLTARGFVVWYDNSQQGAHRNIDGMRKGVQESLCLLLFLSGRKEKDGKADGSGVYEGLFTRWFCHEEMSAARAAGLRCIGVKETEAGKGAPDLSLEKARALSGGHAGQAVHPDAAENIFLLDTICFIPFRRELHEKEAMLNEVVRQALCAPVLRTPVTAASVAEGTPPESKAQRRDGAETRVEMDSDGGPPPGDTGGIYAHLISMKLLGRPARTYASKLIAEGYDTVEAVDELSLEELRDDFGVLKGHLKTIERYRNVALGAPSAATTVAKPVAEDDGAHE